MKGRKNYKVLLDNADNENIVGRWVVIFKHRQLQVTTEFGKDFLTKKIRRADVVAELDELTKLASLNHYDFVDRGYESW